MVTPGATLTLEQGTVVGATSVGSTLFVLTVGPFALWAYDAASSRALV